MSAEPIYLAGGVNSRTGQPYRFRHGWILREPGLATGRQHMRGLENAEIRKPGSSLGMLKAEAAKRAGPTRGQVSRRITRTVHGAKTQPGSLSEIADKATAGLRGKPESDYQHRAAARLHMAAARGEKGASAKKAHHIQMAAMHRGIAARTAGHRLSNELAVPHSETTGGRKSALKRGLAIAPPSPGSPPGFPVTDARHWEKARQAVGRVKNPARRAAVASLLRRTAPRFGKTAALQKSWVPTAVAAGEVPSVELATSPRYPVSSPYDVLITRSDDGSAVVRHRRGGFEIGRIKRGDDGAWMATRDGRDGTSHTRQRGALLELIGTHNRASGTPYHRPEGQRAEAPLQPPPVQTPLMAAYGITNVRALANTAPVRGASDGPRATEAGGDGKTGRGLSPRGQGIYGKLRKRGFPHERAHAFARRAQNRAGRK